MKFFDRLLTIVITATLTSAVWIVFGTTLISMAEGGSTEEEGETPELVEPPVPAPAIEPEAKETPSAPNIPVAPPVPETSVSNDQAPIASTTPEGEPETVDPVVEGDASETEMDASIVV